MKARLVSSVCLLSSVLCLLATSGCSLVPEAKSDPTRFYVLSSSGATTPVAPTPGAPTVHLRPVDLTNYLRAHPVIVRRGNNEIEFREFARWGEPLEQGIARVLREELLARGAAGAVVASGMRREQAVNDYSLSVRVLACEGVSNGGVEFRAIWELSSGASNASAPAAARGDYHPTDLRWDAKSEASLAAQLSQAVAGLAAEISAALKK